MTWLRRLAPLLVPAILFLAPAAQALINPRFTPRELVKQSRLILAVDVAQGASKDEYRLTIREVLKGKTDDKVIAIDITKARDPKVAQALRDLVGAGKPGLFFVGEYENDVGTNEKRGLLHVEGLWASCVAAPAGPWLYDTFDDALLAVWNGGTDMMRRAVDYVIADEDDAVVPVADGVRWSSEPRKVARFAGAIRGVRPVDLAGDGTLLLFVARDDGDRLLARGKDARTISDVTEARGLGSKSVAWAWGDFSGQGRLDLVSFDGAKATLHAQQADGRFAARPLDLGTALENGCLSLAALDVGPGDRAGFVVGGNDLPVVVALDATGRATATPLTAPGVDLAALGRAGVTLVADFDGDGFPDVLAVRELGGILFRGRARGQFEPGVASAVACKDARAGVCVGDYDGDGNLDVLVAGGKARFMWVNDGKGRFTNRFNAVGEMMTHDQIVVGADCMVGDVNNDGRQDILLGYANASPVTYFARGFLSFGHSHSIDIKENNLLPDANNAADGIQSGCLADVDGDGAQDMVIALASGEIWVLFRENEFGEARMVVAALPAGGACKGPLTVTGWIGKRCLGAWNVSPGTGQASFGRTEAGPVTLTWRLPGGTPQTRELVAENGGSLRFELK